MVLISLVIAGSKFKLRENSGGAKPGFGSSARYSADIRRMTVVWIVGFQLRTVQYLSCQKVAAFKASSCKSFSGKSIVKIDRSFVDIVGQFLILIFNVKKIKYLRKMVRNKMPQGYYLHICTPYPLLRVKISYLTLSAQTNSTIFLSLYTEAG